MLRLISAPGVEPSSVQAKPVKALPGDSLRTLAARAANREEVAQRTLLMAVGLAMLGVVRRPGTHYDIDCGGKSEPLASTWSVQPGVILAAL